MKFRRLRGAAVTAALCATIPVALASNVGAASGAAAHAARGASVSIKSFAFHPATLRISRGTVVTVANHDSTTHTFTSSGHFNTGKIKPGHSATVRFSHAGTFHYHCTIHPFMKGTVVVH
jgi:plastocyanin